jgi:hypothetical protein
MTVMCVAYTNQFGVRIIEWDVTNPEQLKQELVKNLGLSPDDIEIYDKDVS